MEAGGDPRSEVLIDYLLFIIPEIQRVDMRSSHALTRRACLATVHSRLSAVALCAQRRVAGAVVNTAGSKPWSRAWHGQSPAPRSEVTKRRIRTMPRGRAGVPAAVVLATITVACILQLAVPVNAHEESSQSGGTFHECIHDQIAGAHVPNVAYVATSAGRTAEDDGLFAREALLCHPANSHRRRSTPRGYYQEKRSSH